MINWLTIFITLVKKDLLIELKSKEIVITITLFSLLVVSIFAITSNNPSNISKDIGAGIIWASVVFSGSIAMSKFFSHEEENQTLSGVLLMPVPTELIFFSKASSLFIFLSISEILILIVFSILFNLNALTFYIVVCAIIFNFGFSLIGTFFGTISSKSKSKEILLTLLMIPIIIPIIMFATELTRYGLHKEAPENLNAWLGLGISFDIIFFVLLTFLFGKIIEE